MTNQEFSNPHPDFQRQNLRQFTVQICHASSDRIVGTGFVVSKDGKIVTCKHVVKDAIVEKQVAKGGESECVLSPSERSRSEISQS